MNYGLNRFDFVVVDEASMISAPTFQALATTFNRLNLHPVVVFPGDKYQQQPLETVGDRVSATTSIINDQQTFHAGNAIKHFLYQQFRIIDEEYAKFLDLDLSPPRKNLTGSSTTWSSVLRVTSPMKTSGRLSSQKMLWPSWQLPEEVRNASTTSLLCISWRINVLLAESHVHPSQRPPTSTQSKTWRCCSLRTTTKLLAL